MVQKKWYWLDASTVPTPGAPPLVTGANVEWMADNGWGLLMYIHYNQLQQAAPPAAIGATFDLETENAFEVCTTYDVPVMLFLNEIFYPLTHFAGGDPNFTDLATTRALCADGTYLENKYGDLWRYIEDRWGPGGYDGAVFY